MCLRVSALALMLGWDKQKDSVDLVSSRDAEAWFMRKFLFNDQHLASELVKQKE